ncbi:type IV pilus biogenesis/stability protein PilW [Luteimonas deserti]|uniref:Type IV pilus biogenesis/stability protein PilW n=1 Tax=Luteimonas deserti TaxID=2752306 RepID=A0A7Z0QT12_9GAMM|nr:type IV pilus biogenesis/stability protein PilW [Luteimonas deserti]NYZ64243.1 type IV pilus biogenesis/stability protein PilW [Luteimonas deserti]
MHWREAAAVWMAVAALAGCKPTGKSNLRVDPPSYTTRGTPEARRTDEARQQLALATRELGTGNDAAAERFARQALKADATVADANTILAMVAERRGRREQAGAFYRAAAEHAPDRGAYLNNYGAWLCTGGRAAESLAYFDGAMRDPRYGDPAGALANAGACALDAGQPGRAEADLRAALAIDPESPVALDAMARLLHQQERHFEARAFSQRHLAVAPASAAALQLAARIEQGLGDTTSAERYLQRLRTDFPSSSPLQPREATSP